MLDQAAPGQRIRDRRKDQGLTQEEPGTALGVTAQAVSKWENGESAPDVGILPELCQGAQWAEKAKAATRAPAG